MKSTLYICLFSICFSLNLPAQKYASMIMEDWVNGNWVISMRLTNTFDSNGNVIAEAYDGWNDTTKVWEKNMLSTHTLNSNSTINYTLIQMWNKDENKWDDMQKMMYTYDGSKNTLTQKTQWYSGTDWMDYSMANFTYDASGHLVKNINQQLDFMTMMMKDSYQSTYSYNDDGTENQHLSQNWNSTIGIWENTTRSTNIYDSKRISSILTEEFTTGAWVNSMKSIITYNENGSANESLTQEWNISTSSWVDTGKEFYSYYPDGTNYQMLMTEWKTDLNKWENQSRITYTNDASSFIKPGLEVTNQLRVFPNPFTDVLSIEYKSLGEFSIQLFNANGQLVRTIEKGESISEINLVSLKNGVYFLKVVSPESQKVVKILKNK